MLATVIQSADGTAGLPTNSDAVLCQTLTVTPLELKKVERNKDKPYMGGAETFITGQSVKMEATVELTTGGSDGIPVAGNAPQFSRLMQGAGWQQSSSVAVTNTSQTGGSITAIKLHTGASAVDDFYLGHAVVITSATGTTAINQTDRKLFTLSVTNDIEYGNGSNDIEKADVNATGLLVTLPATGKVVGNVNGSLSTVDDYYVGNEIKIGSETRTISDFNATTRVATVSVAFTPSQTNVAFTVFHKDDFYVGDSITSNQYSGTLTNANLHTKTRLYIPLEVVGNSTLMGMEITVAHGSTIETRKITKWVVGGKDSKFADITVTPGFSFMPTAVSDTYKIGEERTIVSYIGSTHLVTTDIAFKYAIANGDSYSIGAVRIITNYVGATNLASVDVPFSSPPNLVAFTIPEYVKYTLKSGNFVSLTNSFYIDGVLHSLYDAKGSCSVSYKAGEIPMLTFPFTGLFDRYEEETMPTLNYSNFVKPLAVNAENTSVIIHGYKACASDISADLSNTVVHRDLIGCESVKITDRAPKGSITIEAPRPSEKDFIDITKSSLAGNLIVQHGVIGNMSVLSAPAVHLYDPTYADQDGITMLTMALDFQAQGDGNNELALIFQ